MLPAPPPAAAPDAPAALVVSAAAPGAAVLPATAPPAAVVPAGAPVDGVGAAAGTAVLVVLDPCMWLAFSPPQAAANSEIPATPSMYAKRASFM
jgi:hypothetical protein